MPIDPMTAKKLASPSLLFEGRAEVHYRERRLLRQIADAKAELIQLDAEKDRLDCVISLHLARDPGKAVKTSYYGGDGSVYYAISLVDERVDCRPMIESNFLVTLKTEDVEHALAEHDRLLSRVAKAVKGMPRFSPAEIREAVVEMATYTVFGADAATAIFPDDDDTGEFEPVGEASPFDQDKTMVFPGPRSTARNGRDVKIADGVAVKSDHGITLKNCTANGVAVPDQAAS